MRKKDPKAAPRKPRQRRRPRSFHETLRHLESLPASAEQTALLADALALWTRYMLGASPAAAPRVYRALFEAWGENRAEVDGDERDRQTVAYHGAFLDRLRELRGEERGYPVNEFDRERSAELGGAMRDLLAGMAGRVSRASAPSGEGLTTAALDGDPWAELGEGFEDFLEEEGIED